MIAVWTHYAARCGSGLTAVSKEEVRVRLYVYVAQVTALCDDDFFMVTLEEIKPLRLSRMPSEYAKITSAHSTPVGAVNVTSCGFHPRTLGLKVNGSSSCARADSRRQCSLVLFSSGVE